MMQHIIVLGAGPAGATVALGLKRLGYQVTVVSQPRPFAALEGISSRVVQGLKAAGFQQALHCINPPSARNANWNGRYNNANTEHLVNRQALDAAIWRDLQQSGIRCVEARVTSTQCQGNHLPASTGNAADKAVGVTVSCQQGECSYQLQGDFLVEARGRAAPATNLVRQQGPKTLSLLQYWQGPPGEACSAAVSFEQGWAWLAQDAEGHRYLQLTLDPNHTPLPEKAKLAEFCQQHLQQIPQAQPFMKDAQPVGVPHARISTAVLYPQCCGANWLRVGDAAMAVDPLSGNGIFQAISSALQAPAVINTLLQSQSEGQQEQQEQQIVLAQQFHQQRIDGLFWRFARIGRDFYRMEQQWPVQPFWQQRNQWPDAQPLHLTARFEDIAIVTRPVVSDNRIVAKKVVVTPDQPLGIWHLAGVELAPIVEALRQRPPEQSFMECLAGLEIEPPVRQMIINWAMQLGYQQ
ncbi:MAG: FAD-dependent monooxygenase [Marinobacterium sp.]|nr:FAD-dependent monooxygenase [Marinobacterium sp.]